jgi:membrane associated rhomboid family serine protease
MFLPYSDETPREGEGPWLNWMLILVNAVIFFYFSSQPGYDALVYKYGFTPAKFERHTLFTSMFLHGDTMHLLGNMWFLYLFGDNVESRCGKALYLLAYLAAGVAGDLSHYAFFPHSAIPSIGASGAIFGVMGMYIFFFPANRIKVLYWFYFIGTTTIRAIWVIGLWAGMEVLYSHLQTKSGMESGVGHLAHSGGFFAGMILAAFYSVLHLVRDDSRSMLAHLAGRAAPHPKMTPDWRAAAEARVRNLQFANAVSASDPRHNIVGLLHAGRIDEARMAWRRYAFDDQTGVLPPREQLEVALALDKNGERGIARDAYERLLANHPQAQPFAAEANLALAGMLLQESQASGDRSEWPLIAHLLRQAMQTHPHHARRELAARWLQTIESA